MQDCTNHNEDVSYQQTFISKGSIREIITSSKNITHN